MRLRRFAGKVMSFDSVQGIVTLTHSLEVRQQHQMKLEPDCSWRFIEGELFEFWSIIKGDSDERIVLAFPLAVCEFQMLVETLALLEERIKM